jgi:hypothetical protein
MREVSELLDCWGKVSDTVVVQMEVCGNGVRSAVYVFGRVSQFIHDPVMLERELTRAGIGMADGTNRGVHVVTESCTLSWLDPPAVVGMPGDRR